MLHNMIIVTRAHAAVCLDNLWTSLDKSAEWRYLQCRLERANRVPCSYVHRARQLVPGLGTSHNECTVAKVRDRGGDYKVATSS